MSSLVLFVDVCDWWFLGMNIWHMWQNIRTHVALLISVRISRSLETFTWVSYQIRKIAGCACAGNAGNVFPRHRFQRKPLVSDPGMHHGTCVTHVPWCMSGSLTCGDGENVPGIPGACAPAILRIWQEAHDIVNLILSRIPYATVTTTPTIFRGDLGPVSI